MSSRPSEQQELRVWVNRVAFAMPQRCFLYLKEWKSDAPTQCQWRHDSLNDNAFHYRYFLAPARYDPLTGNH
jgi:hypothetical protein